MDVPALCHAEDVADYLGIPVYSVRFLVKAGHLKYLGRPSQNSVKKFARVEIEHLALDRDWLSKAVFIIERAIQEKNRKASQNRELNG